MFAVPPPSSSSLAASPRPRPAPASSSSPNTITELDNDDAPAPAPVRREQSLLGYLASNPTALLTDHERCFGLVATAILLAETLLSAAIVRYVPCKPHTTLSRP
jgi:hypothetical protein